MISLNMYKFLFPQTTNGIFLFLTRINYIKRCLRNIKEHHPETYEHSLRVGKISIELALENRFSRRIILNVGKAGLLHDFGKCFIDKAILSKTGPLNEEELAIMKKHPKLGAIFLNELKSDMIKNIMLSHHEFKATPYPRVNKERRSSLRYPTKERRKNIESHELAQIVAVADMFDALAFPRSYKPSFEREKVYEIIGAQFTGNKNLIRQMSERF